MGTPEGIHLSGGLGGVIGPGVRRVIVQVLPTEQHHDAIKTATGGTVMAAWARDRP
jgi:hypothetical protein